MTLSGASKAPGSNASAMKAGATEVFYKPGTMRELAEMLQRVFAG